MRATRRRLRRSLAFALICVGFATVFGVRGHAASTPMDADVFALKGGVSVSTAMQIVMTPVPYTVDSGTACATVNAPSPVSTSIPGFLDAPADESGACTGVTGGGTFNLAGCSVGQISADWQITEPAGDSAHFVGAGIMVGAVAIMATPTSGAYTDDARSGQGTAVALMPPSLNQTCGTSLSNWLLIAVVAGAY